MRIIPIHLLLFAALILPERLQAQLRQAETIEIGSNAADGTPVFGSCYRTEAAIVRGYTDIENGRTVIATREVDLAKNRYTSKGHVEAFDLVGSKRIWSKDINMNRQYVMISDSTVLCRNYNTNFANCLRIEDGGTMMNFETYAPSYIDRKRDIALGVKIDSGNERVCCHRLSSGEVLWKRKLKGRYSFNNVYNLNDSTLLVDSNGLHTLGLTDGQGWSYPVRTGADDNAKTFGVTALGVAAGLLTGTFFFPSDGYKFYGIESNLLADSTGFVIAGADRISRISRGGVPIWEHDMSKRGMSASHIIDGDSTYVLFNMGFAIKDGNKVDFGQPFVAMFDKASGDNNIFEIFDKRIIAGDVYDSARRIIAATDSSLTSINTDDGTRISVEVDSLLNLIDTKFCMAAPDGRYRSLGELYGEELCFAVTTRGIEVYDPTTLMKTDNFAIGTLHAIYTSSPAYDGYRLLTDTGNGPAILIDDSGNAVATIDVNSNVGFCGDRIISISQWQVICIDLTETLAAAQAVKVVPETEAETEAQAEAETAEISEQTI